VLCEIAGPHDLNLDLDDVRARLTERTRAIMAVHFLGYPAPLGALRELCDERGLTLIEDAAQAVGGWVQVPGDAAAGADRRGGGPGQAAGRRTGTVGDLGCYSFFSKKQLCTGEGGMVVTADEGLAARVRLLRSHAMTSGTWDRHRGHAETYDVVDVGFNFRLDEPRAALGLSRLARLDADIEQRRARVESYRRKLTGISGLTVPWSQQDVARSSHFGFAVLLEDRERRDALRTTLSDRGIQTTWYPAVTQLSAYADHGSRPRSEEAAARHCALPLYADLDDRQQELVIEAVRETVQAWGRPAHRDARPPA
jgi:dTDP-4-amino-4,6-dideoxygalactose transaminase